jgi:hypothetical protein
MEIYGNAHGGAARDLCIDFATAKNTVLVDSRRHLSNLGQDAIRTA